MTSRRVLVVDDNPLVLRAIGRLIRHLGHELTTADSLTSASERLATAPFDIVISDLRLGDGSGQKVLEVARTTQASATRLVLLSDESDAVGCPPLDGVNYVSKGVESSTLVSLLRSPARRSRPPGRAQLSRGPRAAAACVAIQSE